MTGSIDFLLAVFCAVGLFFIGVLNYYPFPKLSKFALITSGLMNFVLIGHLILRGF